VSRYTTRQRYDALVTTFIKFENTNLLNISYFKRRGA